MRIIKSKFDKHDIADLPKVTFEGRIIVVISEAAADCAVDYLLAQPILGFDTETKPSFKPGTPMNKVALLQVATPDTCFLFRLNLMGLPPCIIRLLEDRTVTKIGLSWHDDLMQLHRRQDFKAGEFVELQQFVGTIGIRDLSLQKIYANLFGQKISKTQRLTNWEAGTLTPGQQVYAATDAWACIQIYNEVMQLNESKDFTLEVIPEPELPQPSPKKETQPEESKPRKEKPVARKPRNYRRKPASSKPKNLTKTEKNENIIS